MTNKKKYTSMKLTKIGNLDEITLLSMGKSGAMTDGSNVVGNMMN